MIKEQFNRTAIIYSPAAIEKLNASHVAVFGVGGVGGYVVEALARSGVSHFTLVDNDTVSVSNINRQIIATYETVGRDKVDVMKERILSINPDSIVECKKCFFLPDNQNEFDFSLYDYVIDCVDTVSAKIALVETCYKANTKIISSMGAGNKIDPMGFLVSDIYKTEMDPLAHVMRHELRKRNIPSLKVVYSKEKPLTPLVLEETKNEKNKPGRGVPGSNAFVPSAAGLLIASEVIYDLVRDVTRIEIRRK